MRWSQLKPDALKGRLLDAVEDTLNLDEPEIWAPKFKGIDLAAKIGGVYEYNRHMMLYDAPPSGAFSIAEPYTEAEEAEIRRIIAAGERFAADESPDWALGRSARPFPKQAQIFEAVINSNAKTIVLAIARQFGKTWIGAMTALYYALNYDSCNVMWVSPYHSNLLKVLRDFERYLLNCPAKARFVKSASDMAVEFPHNRSRIDFRQAANDVNIRGNTMDVVIVDEAAFMKEDAFNKAIKPTAMVRGRKMVVMSSPNGSNWFHDLYRQGEDGAASVMAFRATSADNPLISPDEIELARRTTPENAFRQEILAEFVEDGGAVFRNVMTYVQPEMEAKPTPRLFAGVDIAKENDFTAVCVLNEAGEMVFIDRFQGGDWLGIADQIAAVLGRFDWPHTYVETNGVGGPVFDLIVKHDKKKRVWGFKTTQRSKQQAIQALQIALLEGRTKIANYAPLIEELKDYAFSIGPQGFHYAGRDGRHDDTVIALALANAKLDEHRK